MRIKKIKQNIIDIFDVLMGLAGVILIPIFLLLLIAGSYSMMKYYSTRLDAEQIELTKKYK